MSVAAEVITEYLALSGRESPALRAETKIMRDLEIDSLGLAEIVIMLEQRTGVDPFAHGFREFETIAELDALYST
ncbi:MAG: hypothetical protein K2X99_10970 [Gemmatimonadaceae bacterium]|nr:hypothetical protein [Gemmatimonadaceae bacterium]